MLDGAVNEIEIERETAASYQLEWTGVHTKLRELARRRVELEAEEGTYLLEAEDLHVFKRLGYRTMVEYMVGELDYTRHAANERLRVTHELLALPKLAAAYRSGELCFSKVRELSRVVTPASEEAFLAEARRRDSHQVAKLVSGLKRGDLPDARTDPALVTQRIVFELHAETLGMLSARTKALQALLGREPTHDELVIDLCTGGTGDAPSSSARRDADLHHGSTGDRTTRDADLADDPGSTGDRARRDADLHHGSTGDRTTRDVDLADDALGPGNEPVGAMDEEKRAVPRMLVPRPRTQQLVLTCKHCGRSELVVNGEALAIDEATADRLLCDAELVGDAGTDDRSRVTSKIPAALRRKVFIRDRFRCVVPGCTARRHLDIHHLTHLEHGGRHTMTNLCVLCFHHKQHHDGALDITGTAPHRLELRWRSDEDDERSPTWD